MTVDGPEEEEGEDPFVAWERLNRLTSQLQTTLETVGYVVDQLAEEVERQRPDV